MWAKLSEEVSENRKVLLILGRASWKTLFIGVRRRPQFHSLLLLLVWRKKRVGGNKNKMDLCADILNAHILSWK